MTKRKQTIQWLKENREYNEKAKRKQTIQWLKENRNTMTKRKQWAKRKQTILKENRQ